MGRGLLLLPLDIVPAGVPEARQKIGLSSSKVFTWESCGVSIKKKKTLFSGLKYPRRRTEFPIKFVKTSSTTFRGQTEKHQTGTEGIV